MANININIKIEGLDKLVKALARFPQVSVKHINTGIKKSMYEIDREAKQLSPVDTGRLRSSFQVKLTNLRGEIGPTVNYAADVHEGRSPGSWPPYGIGTSLELWARRKGIPAFLVARKIATKGTKGVPFLRDGVEAAVPAIEHHIRVAFGNVMDEITKMAKR